MILLLVFYYLYPLNPPATSKNILKAVMLKEMSGPYYIVCGYTDLRRGIDGLNIFGYLSYLLTELPKLGDNPTDNLLPWSDMLPGFCK